MLVLAVIICVLAEARSDCTGRDLDKSTKLRGAGEEGEREKKLISAIVTQVAQTLDYDQKDNNGRKKENNRLTPSNVVCPVR